MEYRLAIDIGASGGRHIVGHMENGRLVTEEIYRFTNGMTERNGHLCWDGEKLFAHVLEGLRRCGEKGCVPTTVGIDTWGVDYVLLDENDRQVGEWTAYRDSRTDREPERFDEVMPFSELYARTGTARHIFNTLYQLIAFCREEPETASRVRDILLVPEYLNFLLTGRKAHEWTDVSTTALADPRTHRWSMEVIRAAGLPERWFETPILEPGILLGTLRPELVERLGFDTRVMLTACHDTGSAYPAVPARDENAVFLSSGTWSLLGAELERPDTGEASLRAGFTNEGGYGGTIRFLKNIMGMWMLQRVREETGSRYSFAEMADMAGASDYMGWVDAGDDRFLSPVSMTDEVRAALREKGEAEPETDGDLFRAVTYGLAVCYRDSIRELEALTGRHFTSINIVGGGCRNRVLNRMTARLTGLPVFAGPTEGTALGNIAVQMLGEKVFKDLAEARRVITESTDLEVFEP